MIMKEYLTGKGLGGTSRDLCPSNTPTVAAFTNGGMKVLPPIKASSNSLERTTSYGYSASLVGIQQPTRQVTGDLARVDAFKKRDLRGGKRARAPVSVGKTSLQRSNGVATNLQSERKTGSIA